MAHPQHEQIFKSGSRTYYNSSRFFPKKLREDVFILYGFVRVADNFVDATPQNPEGFYRFCSLYREAAAGKPAGELIIDSYVDLARRRQFDPAWTDAFLASMEMDLTRSTYDTLEDTLAYIYGSAEVIGLFMSRIMDLDHEAERSAALLGRAMQYINFIRDIDEDLSLGRRYLPLADTPLTSLTEQEARNNRDAFCGFIRREISRYDQWQAEAETGYRYIPRRYRIPIQAAAEMYRWTSRQIAKDPFRVYREQVKPGKPRILLQGLRFLLGGRS